MGTRLRFCSLQLTITSHGWRHTSQAHMEGQTTFLGDEPDLLLGPQFSARAMETATRAATHNTDLVPEAMASTILDHCWLARARMQRDSRGFGVSCACMSCIYCQSYLRGVLQIDVKSEDINQICDVHMYVSTSLFLCRGCKSKR